MRTFIERRIANDSWITHDRCEECGYWKKRNLLEWVSDGVAEWLMCGKCKREFLKGE